MVYLINIPKEKPTLVKQYKKLRNLVSNKIRKETLKHNNDRIAKAQDENEVWNNVNDVVNPNKENTWRLNGNDTIITDEQISNHPIFSFIKVCINLREINLSFIHSFTS